MNNTNSASQYILIIHGGDSFNTYNEYISNLKDKKIDILNLRKKDWKEEMNSVLGNDFLVLIPRMPNSQNTKYKEWKIWFEKISEQLVEPVILIGHSLGAIFLIKYLSEGKYIKKIKATFLVSPPYYKENGKILEEFILSDDLEKLSAQGGEIYLYHSKDDLVVDFSNFYQYEKLLPQVKTRIFDDRGHFNQEHFPEIIHDILSLKKQ